VVIFYGKVNAQKPEDRLIDFVVIIVGLVEEFQAILQKSSIDIHQSRRYQITGDCLAGCD